MLPKKAITNEENDIQFVKKVIHILNNGSTWRSIGKRWNSVYRRFRRWCEYGIWNKVFNNLKPKEAEYIAIDATYIRANHQANVHRDKQSKEGFGRSKGGYTSKIHATVNKIGLPMKIIISPGNTNDCEYRIELVSGLKAKSVLGDKGYDSNIIVSYY